VKARSDINSFQCLKLLYVAKSVLKSQLGLIGSHKNLNEVTPSISQKHPVVEGDSWESTVFHSTFCHDPDWTWKQQFIELYNNFHFSPIGLYNKGGVYHLNGSWLKHLLLKPATYILNTI